MKRVLCLLLLCGAVFADQLTEDPPEIWDSNCIQCLPPPICCPPPFIPSEDVKVDLMNPIYENGVISTCEGGVLTAPGIRVQARHIVYTKNESAFTIFCEGDLMIDYKNHVIVGQSLFFDFKTNSGCVKEGRTAAFPWFVGGREVLLCVNGDLVVLNGYITTSEGGEREVVLATSEIRVTRDQIVTASNITFEVMHLPVFWLPKIKVDLKTSLSSPLAMNAGWHGFLGPHVGVRYHFLTLGDFKAYARADGYFGRGFGGGIETAYDPRCACTEWFTRNYYVNDLSIDTPKKRNRYRFQGSFYDLFLDRSTTCNLYYDFVSDAEMAQEFEWDDFELNTAGRTELTINRVEDGWLANLFAKVKVNSFQTIKQELPSFQMAVHPFEIATTGLFFDNNFRVEFLDYSFGSHIRPKRDFHSARFEIQPKLYRPIQSGPFTVTPKAGFIGIAYSNTPGGKAAGQAIGDLSINVETALSRCFGPYIHTIEPYVDTHFVTRPRSPLDHHFIFSIDDAYNKLALSRFGIRNLLFSNDISFLWVDLWANAFYQTKTVPHAIPKGYLDVDCQLSPILFLGIDGAWNIEHHQLDYINTRLEWTFTENLALSTEYRHRGPFYWRKADFYNFMLESTRSEKELLASPLSDHRSTLLAEIFYRLTPDLWIDFEIRHGWNRRFEPPYTEYKVECETQLFQHWKLNFIYEKRTEDNRYFFTLKLDPGAPPPGKVCL